VTAVAPVDASSTVHLDRILVPIKCASFRCFASGRMRFFSILVMGPSLRWAALLLLVLFDTVELLLIYGEAVLLATAFFCSPRCRVRDNQHRFRSNRQWHSPFFFASRSELAASEQSSLIPTASAVRCYTEMQSCLAAAVFPSILSAISLCLLLRLCTGDRSKIDTRHSLFLSIRQHDSNASIASLPMSTQCSLT